MLVNFILYFGLAPAFTIAATEAFGLVRARYNEPLEVVRPTASPNPLTSPSTQLGITSRQALGHTCAESSPVGTTHPLMVLYAV